MKHSLLILTLNCQYHKVISFTIGRVTSNVFYPGKLPFKKGEIMITLYKGIYLESDLGPKSGWRNQFNKFQPTFVIIR